MNYIKTTTDTLLKAINFQKNGYNTPKSVIEKLDKLTHHGKAKKRSNRI